MQTKQEDGTPVFVLMVIVPALFVLLLAVFGGLSHGGVGTQYDDEVLHALTAH